MNESKSSNISYKVYKKNISNLTLDCEGTLKSIIESISKSYLYPFRLFNFSYFYLWCVSLRTLESRFLSLQNTTISNHKEVTS